MKPDDCDSIHGCLLGCAVGDSLGLPAEGLSRRKIAKRGWTGKWKHRFVFGRGMISDDTEHSLMVAQAMLAADGDVDQFRKKLAGKLRWWFLALPAGVGMATAKSCLKLWLGISPKRSGVHSAGNGPAMRSGIIGAAFADNPEKRRAFTEASTYMTHSDPRALIGAMAVADAVTMGDSAVGSAVDYFRSLGNQDQEWQGLCDKMAEGLSKKWSIDQFAEAIGCEKEISGFVYQTVPMALFAVFRHRDDFASAIEGILDCGGDTDSVAAIAGAIAGAWGGPTAIPSRWVDGIAEWPRSRKHIKKIAEELAKGGQPVPLLRLMLIPRNLAFLLIVLAHGLRRLLP